MKKSLIGIIFILSALASAQQSQPVVASSVSIPAIVPAMNPITNASASLVGNPGSAKYCYWLVTNYVVGNTPPTKVRPCITAGPVTLSSSNYDQITFNLPPGATSADVLRTSGVGIDQAPQGSCACAVATGNTTGAVHDQSNSLSAYTVSTYDPSVLNLGLTNEVVGAGASHLKLRQGGVLVADLNVSTVGLPSTGSTGIVFQSGPSTTRVAVQADITSLANDLIDPGANGLAFRSSANTTRTAVLADVTGLGSTGSGNFALANSPTLTGSTTTCSLNGMPVLNSGCYSGSDVGAQINSAYAACPSVGCHIKIPPSASAYVQTTPIVFATNNKPAWLDCDPGAAAGISGVTTFSYTPTTGVAVSFQTGTQQGNAITGCRFVGPGSSTVTLGLLSGGCPTTLGTAGYCTAGSQALVGAAFVGIDVESFGIGVVLGNNHYLSHYDDMTLLNNGINLSYPSGTSGTGEGLRFSGGVYENKTGPPTPLVQNCADFEGPFAINFAFYSVHFDNCPVLINPTPSTLISHYLFDAGHLENPNGLWTTTGVSGTGTILDPLKLGSNCGNCNIVLNSFDVLEDSASSGRTELVALGGGMLTIEGGDYRAAATIAEVVNGTGTPNGLEFLNATRANATNIQGGSITGSFLCSMYGTTQCQLTGTPFWHADYPTLAALNTSVPSPGLGMETYCGDCQPTATSCSAASAANCVCKGSGFGMLVKYEDFMGNGLNWYCH